MPLLQQITTALVLTAFSISILSLAYWCRFDSMPNIFPL